VKISGKTNEVVASIALGGQTPAGVAVNFVAGKVYAALNDSSVAIVNEWNNSVTYASYGVSTTAIAVNFLRDKEYVTDIGAAPGTVGVLSGRGSTLASVPVGNFPQGIDVDVITANIFVANEADGTVSKIDGRNNTVTSTTPVSANTVAVNPAESTFYAVGSTSVTVLTEN
jgi:DNA-binding beta-propeller fold protein YncE